MTLAKARQKRDAARRALSDGIDPGQAKAEAKETMRLRSGTSFEAVALAWFEHWKGPRSPRHAD